ncbi:UDP-N-acetylmuramoyl-L-alanyl-D-glutamate--2,6-diaminopimelate ligase [Thermospira aquatica]|uniref:UDP-N-acetylmuramoyl-L-alanyl-D-glutamate--2,6-diaminopimelate ligase n=1 Tax=Thermospira aquatica TaxID=2828656 RepID=A0AAX3BIJ8_9SPIR|nr:UDP-N-acetylmuramoyl-L-alanyl-D-glutamate--2,6-diaminopimelate ligase [Thermospira aquatica]URA11191.1 UDP-N-acetylmuramoyl-L-alanyl-D-glutamate--2,6-diaminopimelate ligase [Thermospira aquatica]
MLMNLLLRDILGREAFETTYRSIAMKEVTSIENDSRRVTPDTLFIAASGYIDDAHPYITDAYERGCRMFLVDETQQDIWQNRYIDAFFIGIPNIQRQLGKIASHFYDHPSMKLVVCGITGTSGKSTTAFVTYQALRKMGFHAGLIGTIEYRINDESFPAPNTTPDALMLQRFLAQMVEKKVEYVIMEVSSHALALGRLEGIDFDIMAFTNFSQDHLDFHKTMEEYFATKLSAIDLLNQSRKPKRIFIYNQDMNRAVEVLKHALSFPDIQLYSISLRDEKADYCATDIVLSSEGSSFRVKGIPFSIRMIGLTNVYNFTMAFAILAQWRLHLRAIAQSMSDITVKGRVEPVVGNGITAVIDYAHKPDALEKVLLTLRDTLREGGRLISVFGAGGDRDRTKRPIMGEISGKLADYTVLTSDNPRTEDPLAILAEIEEGIKRITKNYIIEPDREKAIFAALTMAKPGDIVLIAGKGHEDYQIIGKEKRHFSDREIVEKWFTQHGIPWK